MSKVLVGDLRKLTKELDSIKEIEYKGLKINLKTYLPILDKIKFASSVYESAVDRDNGLHVIKQNALEIAFKLLFLETYATNISLPKDGIDAVDLITSTGMFDFIYNELPTSEQIELEKVLNNLMREKQDEYEQSNKIENIVKNGINEFLSKLDKFVELMPPMEDIEKMPNIIKDVYAQMQSGIANLIGDEKEYAETVTKVALEDVKKIGNS